MGEGLGIVGLLDTSAGSKDTILLAAFRPGVTLLCASLKRANHLHYLKSYVMRRKSFAGHIFYIYIEIYLAIFHIYIEIYLARIRIIGKTLTVSVLYINSKSMLAIQLQKFLDFRQNVFFISRQCLAGSMIELGFDY